MASRHRKAMREQTATALAAAAEAEATANARQHALEEAYRGDIATLQAMVERLQDTTDETADASRGQLEGMRAIFHEAVLGQRVRASPPIMLDYHLPLATVQNYYDKMLRASEAEHEARAAALLAETSARETAVHAGTKGVAEAAQETVSRAVQVVSTMRAYPLILIMIGLLHDTTGASRARCRSNRHPRPLRGSAG
jgi:hypothetical protein